MGKSNRQQEGRVERKGGKVKERTGETVREKTGHGGVFVHNTCTLHMHMQQEAIY